MIKPFENYSAPKNDNIDDYEKINPLPTKQTSINPEIAKKPELTEQERTCQEFVENNKKPVTETLVELLKDKKFILVGEAHLPDCEPIRQEIVSALTELKKAGLTHIALEAHSSKQTKIDDLDYTDPQIKEALSQALKTCGWGDGNYNILITAKLLGLKVVLIDYDDGRPQKMKDNAAWQNTRDTQMLSTIKSQINENSKVLIFIGSAHVHKEVVESYHDGKIKRLGARLVEEYGDDGVSSIRQVGKNQQFDNLLEFMSKSTSPKKISQGKNEVVILPDTGPIKGNEKTSAADYVITII